jgi:type I restriction-modification system DNA methylase subunit
MPSKRNNRGESSGELVGEATLWAAADKLHGHIYVAVYNHVGLGLLLLKYISDAFENHLAKLARFMADPN